MHDMVCGSKEGGICRRCASCCGRLCVNVCPMSLCILLRDVLRKSCRRFFFFAEQHSCVLTLSSQDFFFITGHTRIRFESRHIFVLFVCAMSCKCQAVVFSGVGAANDAEKVFITLKVA